MGYKYNINENTKNVLFVPTIKRRIPYHNSEYLFDIELSNFSKLEKCIRTIKGEKPKHKPRKIKVNKNKIYHYVNGEMDLVYEKLSDYLKSIKIINELKSYKRYGKCHDRSIELAVSIKNSFLLTGYTSYEDIDILHSVVECEKDGKTKIIDYTKNLIMDKEEYIGLNNFRVIQRISREDYLKDRMIIDTYIPNLSTVAYLCFRDEIIKELKNKKILGLKRGN